MLQHEHMCGVGGQGFTCTPRDALLYGLSCQPLPAPRAGEPRDAKQPAGLRIEGKIRQAGRCNACRYEPRAAHSLQGAPALASAPNGQEATHPDTRTPPPPARDCGTIANSGAPLLELWRQERLQLSLHAFIYRDNHGFQAVPYPRPSPAPSDRRSSLIVTRWATTLAASSSSQHPVLFRPANIPRFVAAHKVVARASSG